MARTRGVGRFTVLSACHIEKNRYECFVDVWNTKVYTSRYYRYVGTSVYFFLFGFITRYVQVYVEMEMVECFMIGLVRSLSLVFRTMRRNLLVYVIPFYFTVVVLCFSYILLFCLHFHFILHSTRWGCRALSKI